MARGALVAAGALLVLGGGGVLAWGLTRHESGGMTAQIDAAVTGAIGRLDGDVKAARATVRERALTLAGLQAVQGAVATDVQTAKDMLAGGELAFHPVAGEAIELGQLRAGHPPMTLLVEPAPSGGEGDAAAMGEAASPRRGKPGSYVELMGSHLVITEVSPVIAKDRTNLSGYVMVSRPLDLGPALASLAAAGASGRLEVGSASAPFGTPPAGPSAPRQIPLPSQPDARLVIDVPRVTGGAPMPLVAGGAGGAALGLVLAIAGLVSRRAAAAGPAPAFEPGLGTAQTQLGPTGVTGGTPRPGAVAVPHSGTVGLTSSDLGAGAMIGRWEILERLGSGGMAEVYLARARGEAGFEKLVAVKVMHPHLARNERAVDHFLDEARLAARITHPNVVAIQDLGKIGNDYVIVMEYVDGVDLERLLASARLGGRFVPLEVGLGILCRICDGLNAAHRATAADGTPLHLVHRDVKSANVLVSRQGGVKVVDFGIAKAAKQAHLTIAGETKGTPSMMAPEQRVGEQVDVRADVYSAAAVGFEIVTGHAVNLDLAALAHLGIENWPHLPAPSSLRPQLPPELDGILLSAMAYDRTRRPDDCAALGASIEAVVKAHGLAATDKDIARWVEGELAQLQPGGIGAEATLAPPA